jgi:DNA-binding NarL/FixJ family response regulator
MTNATANETLASPRERRRANQLFVYLVGPHPLQNEYLTLKIQKSYPHIQCRQFTTVRAIYRAYKLGLTAPTLLILETQLPDAMGLSALNEIRHYWENPPAILVYSVAQHLNWEARCLSDGADSFVDKSAPTSSLLEHIHKRLTTSQLTPAPLLLKNNRPTQRQRQLITLLEEGLSNDQIADQLQISPDTVKVHCYMLYKKTGVHTRLQLLKYARDHGWLL